MVGHYWLRKPSLAPTPQIREEIESANTRVVSFAREVDAGQIQGQRGRFENLLITRIGGLALDPQFGANVLGHPTHDKMKSFFLDNTDPDGIQRLLATIGEDMGRTSCIVISKFGGRKETRNGMLEAKSSCEAAGLNSEKHAVAIARMDSVLAEMAIRDSCLTIFPMWDWAGGRASELSVVGLLPAALQWFDTYNILTASAACDEQTRQRDVRRNPAAQPALTGFFAGGGCSAKNMVTLPYKDRLELQSRYLQQLVMESIDKERDRSGDIANQGISAFGNNGATWQHTYRQHIRDGQHELFCMFLEVRSGGDCTSLDIDRNTTTADYLAGANRGTGQALFENGRDLITLTLRDVAPLGVRASIALFERAVAYYAFLLNINGYNQPGVEARKNAAETVLSVQMAVIDLLSELQDQTMTCGEIANRIPMPDEVEHVFKICERQATNPTRRFSKIPDAGMFSSKTP